LDINYPNKLEKYYVKINKKSLGPAIHNIILYFATFFFVVATQKFNVSRYIYFLFLLKEC